MNYILLFTGFVILIITLIDFVYTALSGAGSGFLTRYFNKFLYLFFNPMKMRPYINSFGMIHLVGALMNWIFLILASSYLIFLFDSSFIVNAQSKIPADYIERIYYTIYTMSTLGNGDFSATTGFSKVFSAALSLIVFVMLTTAITYLLSVTNAAMNKKNIASYFSSMAGNPLDLYRYAMTKERGMQLLQKSDRISEKILEHADNLLAFPIIQFFVTKNSQRSLSLHVAIIYETVSVLKLEFMHDEEVKRHCDTILYCIEYLLDNIDIPEFARNIENPDNVRLDWQKLKVNKQMNWNAEMTGKITSYLYSQGWGWSDVYKL